MIGRTYHIAYKRQAVPEGPYVRNCTLINPLKGALSADMHLRSPAANSDHPRRCRAVRHRVSGSRYDASPMSLFSHPDLYFHALHT